MGYPDIRRILTELDDDYFRRFGEQFIQNTRAYRGAAPFFTDKMPNNFFHIGLIKLILPNARIIDARRHPVACCFSGFKQLFGEGQEFSYGLKEIGNYYRQYVKLMDHWDRELPGFVLRVQHEDVVNNLEEQVHRILDFCDLPFEQACVDYHQTERSIRTPSSEQVRQPIYKTGLEQWRNFEPWLGPPERSTGNGNTGAVSHINLISIPAIVIPTLAVTNRPRTFGVRFPTTITNSDRGNRKRPTRLMSYLPFLCYSRFTH